MKKFLTFQLILLLSYNLFAHEGMWIPSLLKALEGDMQSKGLKLSAEDIYSINQSSLKDAIVHFNGGCTAEVVSDKGLILTNHHCGYGQINQHSTLENNYLKNGFWAMSQSEELKNPGLTATFIVRIEDVTAKVNNGISDDIDTEAANLMRSDAIKKITSEAVEGTNYKAVIKPFYYGNEYYMIVSKTYKDVRLVGAPPSALGKFGGDTDNWVWPRHTCDFSVFRIYADKDNNPSDISDENVPYNPAHHFPVSLNGIKKDDFTMVFGFPGYTQQYLTSYAVKDYIDIINPSRIKMRELSLSVIDQAMAQSEKTFIQYASKQSRISNAYKKWIGQNLGLNEKDALAKKRLLEKEFLNRVAEDKKYKNLLDQMEGLQLKLTKYDQANSLFREIWYYGPEIFRFSKSFDKLISDFSDQRKEKKLSLAKEFYSKYDAKIDASILEKLLPVYFDFLDDDLEPTIKADIELKYNGNYKEYSKDIFAKSCFVSFSNLEKLMGCGLDKFKKKIESDPVYQLSKSILSKYENDVKPAFYTNYFLMQDQMKKYVKAQMTYFPNKTFWADANSTLRLTYGKVEGSSPRDGMNYNWYTTLDGIIAKNNTGNPDFEIPLRLRELWEKKDYGKYGSNNQLNVCFLGSNHTTGGNSGSPAINAYGQLIGINFDRSWESTMSDIMFDPEICRNIMVDIRYVLWVIDKYAGAGYLVDEMSIVKQKKTVLVPEALEK
tara:strand:+ start:710 stop:2866 length:2157 start_codon:yes stop_codon:yes gene_type:complete